MENTETYTHQVLYRSRPDVDTTIILGDRQSLCPKGVGSAVVNVELRVSKDLGADDADVEPDLRMGLGPTVCNERFLVKGGGQRWYGGFEKKGNLGERGEGMRDKLLVELLVGKRIELLNEDGESGHLFLA